MVSKKITLIQIRKAVAQFISYLQNHGGGLEVVSWHSQTGTVKIKLTGACHGCALANITTREVIEANLRQNFPQIKKVISIS